MPTPARFSFSVHFRVAAGRLEASSHIGHMYTDITPGA